MLSRVLRGMIVLGEKLKKDCPLNDCVVYRNTYIMWEELVNDVEIVKSEHAKRLLECEISKLESEMLRMYFGNYAVCQYMIKRKMRQGEVQC